jgi:hypothetical protein
VNGCDGFQKLSRCDPHGDFQGHGEVVQDDGETCQAFARMQASVTSTISSERVRLDPRIVNSCSLFIPYCK